MHSDIAGALSLWVGSIDFTPRVMSIEIYQINGDSKELIS